MFLKKVIVTVFLLMVSTITNADVDSAPELQAQIDANCATQDIVRLAPGKYYLYSPLILKTNCKIIGEGADFRTVLIPVGVSAIIIDGINVDGGWAFRNLIKDFSIDGSQAGVESIIKINKVYNTVIDNIFIHNHKSPIGIEILESNAILLNKLIMRGAQGASQIGILIADKASVFMRDVDIEVYSRGIKTIGESTTDISSAYMERNTINIEHAVTGTGSLNIFGGKLKSTNGYNISLRGNNFQLQGTKLESYNGTALTNKVVHCWLPVYNNVKLHGIAPYTGYFSNTNCDGKGIIDYIY
jgi:hypothetical protein